MALLTDRTLTTGVTLNDYIHIVIPSDISQNPAGSSYKATIQQLYDSILPSITSDTKVYSFSSITSSAITITTGYTYYGVNYLGDVDITVPSPTGIDGVFLIIKDEGGNAGSYRIRLTPSVGQIDGNGYVDMNINYMSLTIMARNNNWWII